MANYWARKTQKDFILKGYWKTLNFFISNSSATVAVDLLYAIYNFFAMFYASNDFSELKIFLFAAVKRT